MVVMCSFAHITASFDELSAPADCMLNMALRTVGAKRFCAAVNLSLMINSANFLYWVSLSCQVFGVKMLNSGMLAL